MASYAYSSIWQRVTFAPWPKPKRASNLYPPWFTQEMLLIIASFLHPELIIPFWLITTNDYDNAWVIGLSTGAYRVSIYEWK